MNPNFTTPEHTFSLFDLQEHNVQISLLSKGIVEQAKELFSAAVQSLSDGAFAVPPDRSTLPPVAQDSWILSRSQDLALATATFWFGLGSSYVARHARCAQILSGIGSKSGTEPDLARFLLIASRFYLGAEAYALLEMLQSKMESS
jgi:hypothetical protein